MNAANVIELQACHMPNKTAVVFEEKPYSYGVVNARANGQDSKKWTQRVVLTLRQEDIKIRLVPIHFLT